MERVERALAAIAVSDRPEVWITLRAPADVIAEAELIEQRAAAGERLPLAGVTVAVKDNIDVAGLPTSAGCAAFAYEPRADATAVARLRAAGAIVVGKTNLDQFATGLTGVRSPYGAVRDARRPEFVSGGSSSGSAVAVALGMAELGLATDTAGSGRVPGAFQGVVGLKPSVGLISTAGVVPACRSFDCVSVFATSVEGAEQAVEVMADGAALGGRAELVAFPRLGIFGPATLSVLSPGYRAAFARACAALERAGVTLVEVDDAPFLAAGRLLYDGAFVSERYASVGAFIASHQAACDPTVADIVLAGGQCSSEDYLADQARLECLRAEALALMEGLNGLLVPTAPFQPAIAAVAAEPVRINRELGVFTTFCNLLGLCAAAIPAGTADGGCFGLSVLAPAGRDRELTALAGQVMDIVGGETIPLLVVGAHLSGMALNHQLTALDARLMGAVHTARTYRLFALDTEPAKPGLVRVTEPGGAAIAGELWALTPANLGRFLAGLPQPMALGRVTLADGRDVVGFVCEPVAVDGARDITESGGWRAYLASRAITQAL